MHAINGDDSNYHYPVFINTAGLNFFETELKMGQSERARSQVGISKEAKSASRRSFRKK